MNFLEMVQIEEWLNERGIEAVLPRTDVVLRRFFGQAVEPRGQESDVATAVMNALGDWDECLLHVTQWSIWPSSEDWPKYYAARGRLGERRSIDIAPGHLFVRGEELLLRTFLECVLENAWDADVLLSIRGGATDRRARISHDEFAEVYQVSGG